MELLVFSRLMVSPLLPVSIHLLLVGYIQWLPTPSTGDPVLSSSIFHFADVICIFFFFLFFFYEILKGKHDKSIFVEIFLFWYFFFFFLFFFFFFFLNIRYVKNLNAIDCQYIVLYGIELNRESIPPYEYFSLCVILRETIVKTICKMREREDWTYRVFHCHVQFYPRIMK